jgi:ribulose-bisphosphate carboxylase large chain
MAGADAAIHPHKGGRFPFTDRDIDEIVQGVRAPMGTLKPILPMPGGGMTIENIPEMIRIYGRDVIFLIGGDLHRRGNSLSDGVRQYRRAVEAAAVP